MLSKIDIENEIGKGINIVPFHNENIKENSINFTISDKAWTLLPETEGKKYSKAEPACKSGVLYLKPHSTTIVYTEEVIALNNKLGGTFHAKVGIAAKGVIFSSTMIGPSYCGHLMIVLQNPTNNNIQLEVGDTFISLVVHKIRTKIDKTHTNSNTGGHTGKLAELNITPTSEEQKFLDEDWKKNISDIKVKLQSEKDYLSLKQKLKKEKLKYLFPTIFIFLFFSIVTYFSLDIFVFNGKIIKIIISFGIGTIVDIITLLTGLTKKIFNLYLD